MIFIPFITLVVSIAHLLPVSLFYSLGFLFRFFLELRNCSRPYSNCNYDEIFQMKHFYSRLEEQAVYNNYFQQRKYGFKSYQDAYLEPSQTFTLWSFFENSYQLKSVNTVAKKFHRRCSTGF